MTVRVLLFATYADLLGCTSVDIALSPPATVADVLSRLRGQFSVASQLPERPLVAVNQVHARMETPIADGDELAVLPPMAGG